MVWQINDSSDTLVCSDPHVQITGCNQIPEADTAMLPCLTCLTVSSGSVRVRIYSTCSVSQDKATKERMLCRTNRSDDICEFGNLVISLFIFKSSFYMRTIDVNPKGVCLTSRAFMWVDTLLWGWWLETLTDGAKVRFRSRKSAL